MPRKTENTAMGAATTFQWASMRPRPMPRKTTPPPGVPAWRRSPRFNEAAAHAAENPFGSHWYAPISRMLQ